MDSFTTGWQSMIVGILEGIEEVNAEVDRAQRVTERLRGGTRGAMDNKSRVTAADERNLRILDYLQDTNAGMPDFAGQFSIADMAQTNQMTSRRRSQFLQQMGMGAPQIGTDMDLLRSRARTASLSDMGIGQMDFAGQFDMQGMARDMERVNELTTRRDEILRQIQTPQERFNQQLQRLQELEREGLIGDEEYTRALENYREQLQRARDDTEGFASQTREMSNSLSMTFSSALEDSIIQWESWRDVARSALEDVQRIILRKTFTERAGSAIADWAAGLMSGMGGGGGINNTGVTVGNATPRSFAGGGYTGDSPRVGGMDGKGGFPAMLHPRETVVDHTKGGGAGTYITQHFTIDARGADANVDRKIRDGVRQAVNESVNRVRNIQQRRGSSRV